MSCQDFEEMLTELARERETRGKQQGALAHVESCPRCAARLAGQRTLTMRLRALAASYETAQAPPRVEAALAGEFRRRAVKGEFSAGWGRPRFALAAAAALVLLALGIVVLLRKQPAEQARTPQPAPPPAIVVRHEPPTATVARKASPVPSGKPRPALRRTPAPAGPEIATEFIPLGYEGGWNPAEGGQLVRVRMPRSILTSFGLPMNEDRAFEPIRADVILGNDGVARAIRFVR